MSSVKPLNMNTYKLHLSRDKYFAYQKIVLRRLAISAIIMFTWILIWALVFKFADETMVVRNYNNLKTMTVEERIMWDLIPFTYRGTDLMKIQQMQVTMLNCIILIPLSILLCYCFGKANLLRDFSLCLGFVFLVEIVQLYTMIGNFATEDFITNMTGCIVGEVLYVLLFKRLSTKHSIILAVIFNSILAVATVFSIATMASGADFIFAVLMKTM